MKGFAPGAANRFARDGHQIAGAPVAIPTASGEPLRFRPAQTLAECSGVK
jgi:hypothetical protein